MRVLALLAWILSLVAAQPALAASSPHLQSLEQQLAALLASRSGDVGVAALDLATGETVAINGDKAYPMASTMKVAVAAAYLDQVESGRRTLNDRIAGQSARSLIESMMIKSNNVSTDLLIGNLGGPRAIQEWLEHNQIRGVRVDRNIARLLADKRDLWDLRDSSTPVAMVQMLRSLDKGNILTPANRAYLLDVMARCSTGKNRIRGLLAGVPIAHKTGTLNNYTSDVGYLTLPDGRRLAVAFFARGGTDRPLTIAQAARTIYDGFAGWVRSVAFSDSMARAISAN
ncbi:serine hydrolase [Sphingomonas glaciei]|uniref:Beta-lactamase n=1 Tax=Sphingomonas glaciei TaxID=2938948 RepID=A0ABY5MUJ1_9SPHN|nr:serine hydrolase [Sphingomonas glaciei]UUR07649.1 class A beta-lactamase-related serine hydrolase [Sphingomonas glaciei]